MITLDVLTFQEPLPSMSGDQSLTALTDDDPREVGPFRVSHRLGAGGMGVVYGAVDRQGRRAAVKLIHRELAYDPGFRARFKREISLLQRVSGTCTVRVLAADGEAKQPWLATEYVSGPTLAERVADDGPLSGDELLGLAAGLAEALNAMHSAGVVHRDLKPSNVILSPVGPRVVDMGIARALDETSITGTGVVVGSPGWISPEEYRGDDVGPAADVYGWALLVLYASTARMPFGTARPEVLAMRVLSDTPEVGDVLQELRPLVERALDKDPAQRPTAEQVVDGVASLWRAPRRDSDAGPEDITQFLDRTWAMTLVDERKWNVPASPTWHRHRKSLVITGIVVTAAVAAIVAALPLIRPETSTATGRPSQGAQSAVANVAPPSSTGRSPGSGSVSSPTAKSPSPSVTPTAKPGRRVKMNEGYSFILPADWTYVPNPTVSAQIACLYPKSEESNVGYCGHYGVEIVPWLDGDSYYMKGLDDPQTVNLPGVIGNCPDDNLSRKGTILKSGLHRIGDRRAYYRKARISCNDGSLLEGEMLVLPITRLTVHIEKMPKSRREQVEDILRSFVFPNKPIKS